MPRALRITFILSFFLILAYLYIGSKLNPAFVNTLHWPHSQVKWYLVGAIVYVNIHPFFLFILYVSRLKNAANALASGNKLWDIIFAYPFWIGFVLVVEILPWFVVSDFIKLPFYPFYQRFKTNWLEIQFRFTLAVFLVYGVYVLLRTVIDSNRIRISETILTYRNLPFALDGLRIVHISDIHADSRTGKRKIRRYIKKVNKLRPDLVFFTGDLVTSREKFIGLAANLLGQIRCQNGIYACIGDHDLWMDVEDVKEHLIQNGVNVVEDSNRFVPVGKESLLVTFLTNAYNKRPNLDKVTFLMGQQPRGMLDLVVTHQPTESLIELAAERGYHIFLAGHTHGGQIVLKPFGINFALPRFASRYYRGTSHLERMLVSVNSGLGFSLAPIRYKAPAEITFIKIIRQSG